MADSRIFRAKILLRRSAGRLRRVAIHLLGPKVLLSWSDYTDYRRTNSGSDRWTARFVGKRDGEAARPADGSPLASIVLVTFNRIRMLERCVSTVLANSGDVDYELIVWDNASTDGTSEYMDSVAADNAQVRVIHSSTNIGLNGMAASVRLARGFYIVELDDDVVDVPQGWLAEMIRCFDAVPRAGYLAADVVQNETTDGARTLFTYWWTVDYGDGVVVEVGTVGGWCAITSRKVIDRIGNFLEMPGRIFFHEDGDFGHRCRRAGLVIGVMRNVKVYHACGLAENAAYGCLDTAVIKYSDDPGNPDAEAARKALEEQRNG
jgi:glycosyltransferase involved in cell wall biosynthesis